MGVILFFFLLQPFFLLFFVSASKAIFGVLCWDRSDNLYTNRGIAMALTDCFHFGMELFSTIVVIHWEVMEKTLTFVPRQQSYPPQVLGGLFIRLMNII
jgi:hypothetical protein